MNKVYKILERGPLKEIVAETENAFECLDIYFYKINGCEMFDIETIESFRKGYERGFENYNENEKPDILIDYPESIDAKWVVHTRDDREFGSSYFLKIDKNTKEEVAEYILRNPTCLKIFDRVVIKYKK
ncbi:hypothetical protein [Helicobacter sp. 13S00482-2]|uniref:hypothetical protein n=1 Tax=Helicobacter sp. 13S00482-2 TaxID=1476200 RepID=UPI001179A2D1|nr:hypothetical protein [Helicobacter sp. 13S00482-2]